MPRAEIRALGRVLNRVADLAMAQIAAFEALARGGRCVEIAEEHVSQCMRRLRRAAIPLDRVLVERGDEAGRRRLVEGGAALVAAAAATA